MISDTACKVSTGKTVNTTLQCGYCPSWLASKGRRKKTQIFTENCQTLGQWQVTSVVADSMHTLHGEVTKKQFILWSSFPNPRHPILSKTNTERHATNYLPNKLRLQWEWPPMGTNTWILGPQLAEAFGKDQEVWPVGIGYWRSHVTGSGPWRFNSLCQVSYLSAFYILDQAVSSQPACCHSSHCDATDLPSETLCPN